VIIDPEHRGKGAGRYLIDVMTERAKEELKVTELRLVCHNTNTRALVLYYKVGFKPFDIKIAYDYGQ
jgi:ribosomal protein S18 acetylase RimI-like enzyme